MDTPGANGTLAAPGVRSPGDLVQEGTLKTNRLAAVGAAALALALPAQAAQKMPPPAVTRPAPAARPAAPAPAVPLPPPPAAASARARVAWFGAGIGAMSAFDVGKGLALSFDYGLLRTPPGWRT